MFKSAFCSSFAYLRSKRRSLAKSRTDVLTFPAFRIEALYPKVNILAKQISGSVGKKVRGQNRLGSLCFVQVHRLVPPRPWMNTISALCTSLGAYTMLNPNGPESSTSLVFLEWRLSDDDGAGDSGRRNVSDTPGSSCTIWPPKGLEPGL